MVLLSGSERAVFTSLESIIQVKGAIEAILNNIEVFNLWGVIQGAVGLNKVSSFSK